LRPLYGASARRRERTGLLPAAEGILNWKRPRRGFNSPQPQLNRRRPCAYAGAIPGPLIRLRQGAELRLKFINKLAEPTTLSFPRPCARQTRLPAWRPRPREAQNPDASAEVRFVPPDSGFNLYLPRAGSTDASQQGRGLFGPIIVDEPIRAGR